MEKVKGEAAVTDAELANLSDEERAALEDDGTDDEASKEAAEKDKEGEEKEDAGAEKDAVEKKPKPGKPEDAEEEEGENDAAAAGKDAKAGGKEKAEAEDAGEGEAAKKGDSAKGKEGDDGKDEAEDEDDEPSIVMPRYHAPAVEKYDEQVAALESRKAEALSKFKAGDIELDALMGEQAKVDGERRALDEAKLKHDISVDSAEQADRQAWQNEVALFKYQVKKVDGIDYKSSRTLNAAFDQAVKDLAGAQDKNGNFINNDKSARWFLREGHKQVMKDIGRAPKAGAKDEGKDEDGKESGKDAKSEKAKQAALDARKQKKAGIPKTLAGVPAADDGDAGGDPEFAHLDKLGGLDLEDAVARMTPEQQDKWARSTGVV